MNQPRGTPPAKGRPKPRGPGDGGSYPEHVEAVWPGYLEGGYFDDEGFLRIEYVARERLEPLVRAMVKPRPHADQPLTSAQLRRFFHHCRRAEARLKAETASWSEVHPQIVFLDAAAQDAVGKVQPKIPALFADFISRNVAATRSEMEFLKGFLPHFEALVGFASPFFQRDRN